MKTIKNSLSPPKALESLKVRIAQNRNILHFWYDCTLWWPSGLVPSRICGCDRPMSFKKNKKNLLIDYIHRVIILSWSWFAEEKNYFQNKGVKKQLGAYKITDRVRAADSRWDFEEWLPQNLFRIDLPREWPPLSQSANKGIGKMPLGMVTSGYTLSLLCSKSYLSTAAKLVIGHKNSTVDKPKGHLIGQI